MHAQPFTCQHIILRKTSRKLVDFKTAIHVLIFRRLGDSGLQRIANSLDTLPNLSVLDIQCNGLTHKAVHYLLNAVTKDCQVG